MVQISKDYIINDFPLRTDTAIIVTSHPGHRIFLQSTLNHYMKTNKYVILSYDSHGQFPDSDIMNIPHTVITKYPTKGAEKRIGWLYDVVFASGVVHNFDNIKNIVVTNGDCIWEKPENIDLLIKYISNSDMMCVSAEPNLLHTAAIIMKSLVFQSFVDYVIEKLRINIPESYSPEVLLRDFVAKGGVVNKVPPLQARYPKGHKYADAVDHYSAYNQPSTWKEVIGFRNLGGEHKAACLEHLEPVEKKYIDMREFGGFFSKHERETLYNYYWSNDRRWLYKYWAEGEDSYWNRRYNHLLYYGKEPLYDDTKRKELGPPSERLGHFDRWNYFGYVLKDEEYEKKWKEVIHGCH